MLSRTVYQGKSAGSWKTTARRGSGARTGSPSKRTLPRVGASKPATMLSSVDLPQPDGPRMAANSLRATARLTACRASTRRPPLQDDAREQLQGAVGDEAQQAHRQHRRHADVHAADVVGVPQDVAEAGF